MFIAPSRRTLCRSGAAALMASAALVLGGCGDAGDIQNDQVTGFDDFAQVQSFVGQQATVTADVVQIIGPHAFAIAHRNGTQLLVVHREPAPNLTVNTPVRVTGTARPSFNVPAAQQFAGVDFKDDWFGAFDGEPYIVASNIDTTGATRTGPAAPAAGS